jgi:uncharacterized protein
MLKKNTPYSAAARSLLSKVQSFFRNRKQRLQQLFKSRVALPPKVRTEKKEFYPQHQVSESKYYTGQPPVEHKRPPVTELPWSYGKDKIVAQVRDPWWVHAYWELTAGMREKLIRELGDQFFKARPTLRVYDVSNIIFDGTNAHRFFDIDIKFEANNWYIDVGGPGRTWCIDLGLKLPDGRFITIVRSNVVSTPLDGPSWITDEEWMIPEDLFARLYGMGFGFGRSSPVGKGWQERIKREMISSPGVSSSPVKKLQVARGFRLVVDTELIVYGATEPDAKVTVQGKPISLRGDGTFTLRFALPNGKQVIPVKAVSADQVEERTITPIVNRETR